jgi:RNA polymerase sigma-70 factor, ECF subfamily
MDYRGIFGASRTEAREKFEAESLQHIDALYRNALGLVKRPEDAEDLVQETYLKAIRFYKTFEAGTNLKAWLIRIMYNTFVNRYRRAGKERMALKALSDEPNGYGVISDQSAKSLTDAISTAMWPIVSEEIKTAINRLPDEYRLMVVLADVEEMTYREIAEVLGCPIGTVMSRLHRARRMLQEELMEHAKAAGIAGATESVDKPAAGNVSDPVDLDLYRRQRSGTN